MTMGLLLLLPSLCRQQGGSARALSLSAQFAERRMRHIIAPHSSLVSAALCSELSMSPAEAAALIGFGAVYLMRGGESKAKRLLSDGIVQPGEYIRVHPSPKQYPACAKVDWAERVVDCNEDFLVLDKPSLVPCGPTLDNFSENVIESLKRELSLDQLFLPHRLDVETSGLLVLGRNKAFTALISAQFRQRAVQKRYRALLALSSPEPPFKVGEHLLHFMDNTSTSPKLFRREMESADSLRCESTVTSVSKVASRSPVDWRQWMEGRLEADSPLALALESWLALYGSASRLSFCEVVLDLHTGRTHQCRGQLRSDTSHIAGDVMYIGVTSPSASAQNQLSSNHLALQSCYISFNYKESSRTYSLDNCWWQALVSD